MVGAESKLKTVMMDTIIIIFNTIIPPELIYVNVSTSNTELDATGIQ
jgi:hypothetical protein